MSTTKCESEYRASNTKCEREYRMSATNVRVNTV